MCLANVCLMQRTTYSVSASVSCTGSEDLKSGPRPWNSGMAASCSVNKDRKDLAGQNMKLNICFFIGSYISVTTDTVYELTLINVLP